MRSSQPKSYELWKNLIQKPQVLLPNSFTGNYSPPLVSFIEISLSSLEIQIQITQLMTFNLNQPEVEYTYNLEFFLHRIHITLQQWTSLILKLNDFLKKQPDNAQKVKISLKRIFSKKLVRSKKKYEEFYLPMSTYNTDLNNRF